MSTPKKKPALKVVGENGTETLRFPKAKKESGPVVYRVLTGLNYGDKRVEVGDLVSDIPATSVEWLLAKGHIKEED